MNSDTIHSLRCIAVDDEPIGLRIIESHAVKVPYLALVGSFLSATEALAYVQGHPVELLFVDIQMPDLSGLELVRLLPEPVAVIFTTAHAGYALEGFEVAALDYLLKPISLSRFLQASSRALEKVTAQKRINESVQGVAATELFVKTGYDWSRVNLAELLYIEADDNYLTFVELGKQTLSRMSLSEVLTKLPVGEYLRIHKSYVIALAKVDKVERHQVSLGGKRLPVSASYREDLLRRLAK